MIVNNQLSSHELDNDNQDITAETGGGEQADAPNILETVNNLIANKNYQAAINQVSNHLGLAPKMRLVNMQWLAS